MFNLNIFLMVMVLSYLKPVYRDNLSYFLNLFDQV